MRKFTKEITALIATVAVSATVGTASVTSEEIVETVGEAVTPTEIVTTAGVPLPPDDYVEPTVVTTTAGVAIQTDEYTESTTTTEVPLAGEPMPSDEYIETTEEIPPLAGDIMLVDGEVSVRDAAYIAAALAKNEKEKLTLSADFNEDGEVSVRDAAAIAKYLATKK